MHLNGIKIRDPFVLRSDADKTYYLYGTTDENPREGKAQGFTAYTSKDLQLWEGPFQVFAPPHNFWADTQFWAPEVHFTHGAYYMLASFKADGRPRGVQILKADTPLGPFIRRLGYIDAVNLAKWMQADTIMAITLMDECCPSSTRFAAFNRIPGKKEKNVYPDFTHECIPSHADIVYQFITQES